MARVGKVADEHWQAGGALGEVADELRRERHVSEEQFIAVVRFLHDLQASHGSSAGIVGQISERVQSSVRARTFPPLGSNEAQQRVCRVLDALRQHERETLHFLIMKRELPRGGLADLGRLRSNYQQQKTARAAATGQVRALFASLTELYAAQIMAA